MTENNAIHDFAVKYHSLYVNPQTAEYEVVEDLPTDAFPLNLRWIAATDSSRLFRVMPYIKMTL